MIGIFCTFRAVAKFQTSNISIHTIPCVVTDSAPLVVVTDLHSSLGWRWSTSNKPCGSISAVYYNSETSSAHDNITIKHNNRSYMSMRPLRRHAWLHSILHIYNNNYMDGRSIHVFVCPGVGMILTIPLAPLFPMLPMYAIMTKSWK